VKPFSKKYRRKIQNCNSRKPYARKRKEKQPGCSTHPIELGHEHRIGT